MQKITGEPHSLPFMHNIARPSCPHKFSSLIAWPIQPIHSLASYRLKPSKNVSPPTVPWTEWGYARYKCTFCYITLVQNIYGDTAHRDFLMKKKSCKGAAILWPSGQMSTSEVIPMTCKTFDSQTVVIDPQRIPPKTRSFLSKKIAISCVWWYKHKPHKDMCC